jgi:hypothetical protein
MAGAYENYARAFPINKLKMWDDKGFSYTLQTVPESGELTLTYRNTYTWTHTEITWSYMTVLYYFDYKVCRVDIYVGS